MKLVRAWINQPSTLQQHHKLHGKRVLAILYDDDKNGADIYFTENGPMHSMSIQRNALAFGWPKHLT
jgi:hypothetical protein